MEVYEGLEVTLFISRICIINDTDMWGYLIVWQRLVWAWYDQNIIMQCVHFNHPVEFFPPSWKPQASFSELRLKSKKVLNIKKR